MNYNLVSGFHRWERCPVIMGISGVHSHGVKGTQHSPGRYNNKKQQNRLAFECYTAKFNWYSFT
jgi:hypothetical protein